MNDASSWVGALIPLWILVAPLLLVVLDRMSMRRR